MKTFLKQASPTEREALAEEVGTSVGYLYLLAGDHRRPSPALCHRLVAAQGKLSLSELRPDIWVAAVPKRRQTDTTPP